MTSRLYGYFDFFIVCSLKYIHEFLFAHSFTILPIIAIDGAEGEI